MSVTILQVVAGQGEAAWDLTALTRGRDTAWLAELWSQADLAAAAALRARPISAVESAEGPTANPLSQLCLQLATHVLSPIPPDVRRDAAVILATTHGCLRTDIDFDRSRREANARFASPAAFRNTLPTHIPAELSVKLELHGPVLALAGCNPLALALRRTATWGHPLTLTGVFDHPPAAEPRAIFLLCK